MYNINKLLKELEVEAEGDDAKKASAPVLKKFVLNSKD